MENNHTINVVCIILIITVQMAFAQNAAGDFKKVNATYESAEGISMDVIYKSFADYTTTVENDVQYGSFKKQGSHLNSTLFGIETLQNQHYNIVVENNSKKLVLLDPVKNKNASRGRQLQPVNIDSVLSICSSVKFVQGPAGEKIYKLNFDKFRFPEYTAIDIHIADKQAVIEKIVLYYREAVNFNYEDKDAPKKQPRIEIIYKNINTHPVFTSDQFSESKYIVITANKIKPAGAYAGYELIDQKN